MSEGAAPGWYPVTGGVRFWNGERWTEQFVPTPPVAVMMRDPYATNHILHLLLTVFTFGLWAPIWLLVTIVNNSNRAGARTAELQAREQSGQYPGE